jgi:hypothetical protein
MAEASPQSAAETSEPAIFTSDATAGSIDVDRLVALRNRLRDALAD